ncbi:MAG: universal stress protein [Candidatus Binatia bacterium]
MQIKRILVPIDFSDDSRNALAYACGLATQFGAELFLLHVIEPIHFITASDVYAQQRRLSTAQLDGIAAELRAQGQPFRTMVRAGFPAKVIGDTATRARANLIVMGTHGRTGLAHALIGSIAEKVVRTAHCPVLTVRRPAISARRAARHRAR